MCICISGVHVTGGRPLESRSADVLNVPAVMDTAGPSTSLQMDTATPSTSVEKDTAVLLKTGKKYFHCTGFKL